MHCVKDLCENMLKTIFGTKDSYGSMQDLMREGIWRDLWSGAPQNNKEIFHMP